MFIDGSGATAPMQGNFRKSEKLIVEPRLDFIKGATYGVRFVGEEKFCVFHVFKYSRTFPVFPCCEAAFPIRRGRPKALRSHGAADETKFQSDATGLRQMRTAHPPAVSQIDAVAPSHREEHVTAPYFWQIMSIFVAKKFELWENESG